MSIQAQRSKNGIQFTLSGVVCQQITAWEHTVDKRVFEEQLETGLFRGRPLGSVTLEVMRAAKQAGTVVPYYGAGGSRGAAI
jgi:hypothetical protein